MTMPLHSHDALAPATHGQAADAHASAGSVPGHDAAAEDVCAAALASLCDAAEEGAPHGAFCPRFHHAVELVGRRWTGVVLRAMFGGATRFSDIRAAVPTLSDKMLAERLKELETEGVVTRRVVPSTPVRVEYHLTAKGRDLEAVVEAVSAWASRWVPGAAEPARQDR